MEQQRAKREPRGSQRVTKGSQEGAKSEPRCKRDAGRAEARRDVEERRTRRAKACAATRAAPRCAVRQISRRGRGKSLPGRGELRAPIFSRDALRALCANFAETRGDSNLCLRSTHKFCGDLRKSASIWRVSRNTPNKRRTSMRGATCSDRTCPDNKQCNFRDFWRICGICVCFLQILSGRNSGQFTGFSEMCAIRQTYV